MKKYIWVLVLAAILGWSSYPAVQQLSLQSLGQSAIWVLLAIYGIAYSALMITFSMIGLAIKRAPVTINGLGVWHGLRFGLCSVVPAVCFPLAMWFGPGPMVVPPIGYGLIPIANVAVCLLIDRRTEHPRPAFYTAVAVLISGVVITLLNRPPHPGHHLTSAASGIWIVFFLIMVTCWGFFGMTQQTSIESNGNEPLWCLFFLGAAYIAFAAIGSVLLVMYFSFHHEALKVTWNFSGIAWAIAAGWAAATGTICSVFAAHRQRNPIILSTIQFGSAPVVGVLITYFVIRPRPPVRPCAHGAPTA